MGFGGSTASARRKLCPSGMTNDHTCLSFTLPHCLIILPPPPLPSILQRRMPFHFLFGRPHFSPSFSRLFRISLFLSALSLASLDQLPTESAVRVVRFRVNYSDAELENVRKLSNWNVIMRKSVLASLRFVNKHWLICGEVREANGGEKSSNSAVDCGKLQVTGEETGDRSYRINATFIAKRDPVRNVKVDANSSVLSVLQIGLKGGIFQYTNAMKVLGKPDPEMAFEEAFFCYPGQKLQEPDKCQVNEEKTAGKVRRHKRQMENSHF